jgi:hypothetical protein
MSDASAALIFKNADADVDVALLNVGILPFEISVARSVICVPKSIKNLVLYVLPCTIPKSFEPDAVFVSSSI